MRKIFAWLWVSLDGVVESPDKWAHPYFNDEMAQKIEPQMAAGDTMLLGRRTYQEFAAYWPHQTSDVQFADYINSTPKLVVSKTLKTVEWQHSTLIKGNVAKELSMLTQQPGKDIVILGSATLVRSLLRERLLDELELLVCPIALGKGKRLFESWSDQLPLTLVDSKTFSTGVVSLTYRPAGKSGA